METVSTELMMKALTLVGVVSSSATMSWTPIPVRRRAALLAIAGAGVILMFMNAAIAGSPLAMWVDAAYATLAIGASGAWSFDSTRPAGRPMNEAKSQAAAKAPAVGLHAASALLPPPLSTLGIGRIDWHHAPAFTPLPGSPIPDMPGAAVASTPRPARHSPAAPPTVMARRTRGAATDQERQGAT
ncbi:MAG: hypothetical protein HY556_10145 [Euryarchaeota archaeon]|nr:hypothetical protein [Euryarchaeota archaeon]